MAEYSRENPYQPRGALKAALASGMTPGDLYRADMALIDAQVEEAKRQGNPLPAQMVSMSQIEVRRTYEALIDSGYGSANPPTVVVTPMEKATASAEERYPETEWTTRAMVLAFREAYVLGYMQATKDLTSEK